MTSLEVPSRRGFLKAALTLVAAPALVKASSLMKVAGVPLEPSQITLPNDAFAVIDYTAYMPYDPIGTEMITLDKYSERILAPMIRLWQKNIVDGIMTGVETWPVVDPATR